MYWYYFFLANKTFNMAQLYVSIPSLRINGSSLCLRSLPLGFLSQMTGEQEEEASRRRKQRRRRKRMGLSVMTVPECSSFRFTVFVRVKAAKQQQGRGCEGTPEGRLLADLLGFFLHTLSVGEKAQSYYGCVFVIDPSATN